MDYKSRYPKLSGWTNKHLDTLRHPMPYVGPCIAEITELDAPDESTVFLAFFGDFVLDIETIVWYLVEAPPGDVMRSAFEAGEVSMEDFWDHRGWLIRMETSVMGQDDPWMQYIHPSQMDLNSRAHLQSYRDQSPYYRLIHKLSHLLEIEQSRGEDTSESQRQINEAMKQMPPRTASVNLKQSV
jgi:hypothetical protein